MCTPVSTTHFHLVRWLRPARWFAAADLICARKESDEVAGCERLAAAGCCGAWALWPVLRTDVLDWSHMLLAVACGGAILLAQRHLRVLRRLRRVESALARYKAECQRAQKVLAENQAHLRLALQASATGTWEWDLLSQTVRWSPECHTIFGVRPEEFDGTSAGATQRIHEIDRQRVTHAVQEAIDRQAAWDGEHRIVRPDGAVRWVRALGRALYDDQGRALRMFGTIEDVTQRKQAEREHEKLRCLGEATSDLIVTSDLQGKLTYMNAGGRRLLGLAADQDVRELQFEAFLAPEVRSRYRDTVLPAAQRDGCWAGDLRLCGPANTRLDVHCFTFLIRDQETGEPWCFGNICRDVTESRDAERVLRDREAHLRLALEASVAISFEWEIPHDRVRRLYSPELALPPTDDGTFASFLEVVHPDDRPHLQSNLEIALTSSDGTYVSEHRVVRPNGEIRWLGERGRIEFDSEHRPLRLIGIARDITTQKHAEESLRNSEATLRSFYESSPLLMGVVELLDGDDSDILHVYDSPAAERFFGSPAGRTAGRSARSLGVPAEIIALWVRCYRESQRTGKPVRFEYEHPGPPSPVWFSVVVACIGPAEPNRVRFAYTVEDVTQRKRAEQELREREELLKTATDAADLGIWELDVASDTTPKRTIRHDQMFGFHELQPSWGRAIAERHVLDEDKPRFREAFERAMESGILSFEVRVRWPDGTVHWIAPLGRVYYDDQGRAVRMAGVVADITERKRTEERLREADRRKDEFLAILAHELRNPLAPIRNGLQLLRLRQSDPATTQRTYAMMERQADHMIRLVDDLLEITRITRGQIELRKSYLDAATVVHRTVETSRPKLDAAGHELVLELPSQPLTLHADPVRLTQVLTNLLVNAAKYTEHGGRIVVSAWPDGEEAILSVRDNGVGIPAEVLPHVFELFEQVERSYNHDHGGLGIGLMLVRRLVELHGGTVEARSDGPGCGSEFRVHLPLAAGQLEAAPAGPPVADLDALAGARILIADDNHDVAESLTMLLEAMSADVCTVHEGAAALARLDTYRPTIVILDIGMPGMDGYEVARRVRQHPAGRGVTLISLSGWGHETDRRRSRAAGFDHHLVKPVGLRTLLAALHSAPPSADRMASTS